MWEDLFIAVIVFGCLLWLGFKVVRQIRGDSSGCGCSCDGCGPNETNKESCGSGPVVENRRDVCGAGKDENHSG